MSFLARLKPLNERKGYKVNVYMTDGARFIVERGWYEVSDELAAKLRELHQDHYDPESPELFDVCTREEAMRLEESERARAATARATVSQPASPLAQTAPRRASSPAPRASEGVLTSAAVTGYDPLNPPDDDEAPGREAGRVSEIGRLHSEQSNSVPPAAAGSKGPKTRSKR